MQFNTMVYLDERSTWNHFLFSNEKSNKERTWIKILYEKQN